jgi:hypothetical protein
MAQNKKTVKMSPKIVGTEFFWVILGHSLEKHHPLVLLFMPC